MDVKEKALSIIEQCGSGNPWEICSCFCIKIFRHPLGNLRGYFYQTEKGRAIVLNDNLEPHEERFVCAHELGHFVLHGGMNRVFLDTRTFLNCARFEKEADVFGACLLYPDDEDFLSCGGTTSLLATCTGLREEVVKLRIKQIHPRC